MNTVAKQVYYRDRGLAPSLARRYWREFGDARVVLDVGCGTGELGRYRSHDGVEVHGVDIDAGAVEIACRWERAVVHDVERGPLPYADAAFDAVLAKDIFEHVQDAGSLAREIYRVLRPGGVLVASVVMDIPKRVWADYTHVRGFSRGAARALLEDAGLTVEAMWKMGAVPLSERLGFRSLVPALLMIPGLHGLWASSWELKARK